MKKVLLEIIVVHHWDDGVSAPFVKALERAFEYERPDASVWQFSEVEDPWERVVVRTSSDAANLKILIEGQSARTLFVILVSDKLVNEAEFTEPLEMIAAILPRNEQNVSRRNALCYSYSTTAIKNIPRNLQRQQFRPVGDFGETQIAPYRLALLALHRCRLLLGEKPDAARLRLFISHAKTDGVFFAQALKHAIENVPELKVWYDDEDIASGSNWKSSINDAASDSVFIALRTPAYDQRKVCRNEFEVAVLNGIPIVVVDALQMSATTAPSYLPFSMMPTVRISDGNTHRVLSAALREHLRVLLMQAIAEEKLTSSQGVTFRVWPRLPCVAAIRQAKLDSHDYWLFPQLTTLDAEFVAIQEFVKSTKVKLRLGILEQFSLSSFETEIT